MTWVPGRLPPSMKMGWADMGTDAAGFQAAFREHRGQERPGEVIAALAPPTDRTGALRIRVTRNAVSIRPRMAMRTVAAGRVCSTLFANRGPRSACRSRTSGTPPGCGR